MKLFTTRRWWMMVRIKNYPIFSRISRVAPTNWVAAVPTSLKGCRKLYRPPEFILNERFIWIHPLREPLCPYLKAAAQFVVFGTLKPCLYFSIIKFVPTLRRIDGEIFLLQFSVGVSVSWSNSPRVTSLVNDNWYTSACKAFPPKKQWLTESEFWLSGKLFTTHSA